MKPWVGLFGGSPAMVWVLWAWCSPGALLAAPSAPLFTDHTEAAGLDFVHQHGGTGEKWLPETMGSGGCAFDLDGDGFQDLYLVQSGPLPSAAPSHGAGERGVDSSEGGAPDRVFRNRGDGTFEDVTARSGSAGGYGMGAVCGDIDGDGDDDVFVTTVGRDRLLRNDRGVLREIPLGTPPNPNAPLRNLWSTSATLFDAEGDGDLDLYVVGYLAWSPATRRPCRYADGEALYCHPDVYAGAADRFWRNRGDGTFDEATVAAGFRRPAAAGKGLGVVASDLDEDGDLDLYVANDSTPNFLWRNRGDGTFEEIGLFAGVAFNEDGVTEAGMGVDAGDADGDGAMDLFVTHLSLESNTLYRQQPGPRGRELTFDDVTRRVGLHAPSFHSLGFGTHFVDFDEDGALDLLIANGELHPNVARTNDALTYRQPGQAFRNAGRETGRASAPLRFEPLSAAAYGAPAMPRVARGSLLIDLDNDGARDLLVFHSNDRARLYRRRPPTRAWIGIALEGPADGAGARITVEPLPAPAPPAEAANPGAARSTPRSQPTVAPRQVAETRRGSSYLTSSDPRRVFALGDAPRARVTVRWLDGTTQSESLEAGRYHSIRYRSETPSP